MLRVWQNNEYRGEPFVLSGFFFFDIQMHQRRKFILWLSVHYFWVKEYVKVSNI